MEPIKPCPKCGSRKRGMWLGNEEYGRPWKIVCQTCGMEQWFETGERAYSEWFQVDENGIVHFGGTSSFSINAYEDD